MLELAVHRDMPFLVVAEAGLCTKFLSRMSAGLSSRMTAWLSYRVTYSLHDSPADKQPLHVLYTLHTLISDWLLPTDYVISTSVQLLAEKAREQHKHEAAPVSAPLADGPAPAAAAAATAVQSHAAGSQQGPAALAPAAQMDPSTAWKLERMEAQVCSLCTLCFAPSQLLIPWLDVLRLPVLAAMSGTYRLATRSPVCWLSLMCPPCQSVRETSVGILQACRNSVIMVFHRNPCAAGSQEHQPCTTDYPGTLTKSS